jgi:hypothetical protein
VPVHHGYISVKRSPFIAAAETDLDTMALDDMQRDEVLNKDNILTWMSYTGYPT